MANSSTYTPCHIDDYDKTPVVIRFDQMEVEELQHRFELCEIQVDRDLEGMSPEFLVNELVVELVLFHIDKLYQYSKDFRPTTADPNGEIKRSVLNHVLNHVDEYTTQLINTGKKWSSAFELSLRAQFSYNAGALRTALDTEIRALKAGNLVGGNGDSKKDHTESIDRSMPVVTRWDLLPDHIVKRDCISHGIPTQDVPMSQLYIAKFSADSDAVFKFMESLDSDSATEFETWDHTIKEATRRIAECNVRITDIHSQVRNDDLASLVKKWGAKKFPRL
ncbi:hypothetical protein LZ554_008391 [Drepanopeziza brunnea f. sp. 'monogermtubi']|nr:hypothetical protein LZ554_008391 [Drepanopeziza brunnea f. sp. 'monogermtubi']